LEAAVAKADFADNIRLLLQRRDETTGKYRGFSPLWLFLRHGIGKKTLVDRGLAQNQLLPARSA
jgi:hypothetical protein